MSLVSQLPRTHRDSYDVKGKEMTSEMELELDGPNNNNRRPRRLLHRIIGPPSIRRLQLISITCMVCAFLLMALFCLFVYSDKLNLKFGYTTEDVKDFSGKVQFSLKFMLLPLTWFFHTIVVIITRRMRSEAWNPLGEHEHLVEVDRRILLNTMEQGMLSLFAQLIFLTVMTEEETLKWIPTVNILFIVGRILFWAGYPRYRTFGFCFSMYPSAALIKYTWFRISGLEKWVFDNIF